MGSNIPFKAYSFVENLNNNVLDHKNVQNISLKMNSSQMDRLCPSSGPTNLPPLPLKTCKKSNMGGPILWDSVGQLGARHREPGTLGKDSGSASRADRSRQRQERLHTVGFGLAEGRRSDG